MTQASLRRSGGYARCSRDGAPIASRDDRLVRDWVSQHAPILAEHYLPKAWPHTLVLDELPIHVRDMRSNTSRQWFASEPAIGVAPR